MKADGTKLSMTRGDSETITVSCEGRPFVKGDTVVFTVKKELFDEKIALQKTITEFTSDGKAVVQLAPEDTRGLKETLYRYDVQMTTGSGIVITVVKPTWFVINREVNWN